MSSVLEGGFEVFAAGPDVDGASVLRPDVLVSWAAEEVGQLVDGEIDLGAGAGIVDPINGSDKPIGERRLGDKSSEGLVGIDVAGDALCGDRSSIDEDSADGVAVCLDRFDGAPGPDFDTSFDRCGGERIGESSHATFDVAPHSSGSTG